MIRRVKCSTMVHALALLEDELNSDEDEQTSEIHKSENVNVIFVPPKNIDEPSDNEFIDDEIVGDGNFQIDRNGVVEIEYDAEKLDDIEDNEPPAKRPHMDFGNRSRESQFNVYSTKPINIENEQLKMLTSQLGEFF